MSDLIVGVLSRSILQATQALTKTNYLLNDTFLSSFLIFQESAIAEKWAEIMGPQYEIVVAQLSKFKQVRLDSIKITLVIAPYILQPKLNTLCRPQV